MENIRKIVRNILIESFIDVDYKITYTSNGPIVQAFHNNKYIGHVDFIYESWLDDKDDWGDELEIRTAAVIPEYRRKGVYISMLKYFLKNNKYNIIYLISSINPEWDSEPRSQDADKFWSNIFRKQKELEVNVEEMDGNYIISLK